MKIDTANGGILSPSVMCADLVNLERDIETLHSCGVEYLHIDFMDNRFVPNITFGTDMVRALKNICNMTRDIHIMALAPQEYFDGMDIGEGDIVSVHYEANSGIAEILREIKRRGANAFIAISPDTPVDVIQKYFDAVDGVLLMSVYPGFAGRPMAPGSFERLKAARRLIDESGRKLVLEIDGNVSWQNAPVMRECGADMFVAGSSSIFGKDGTLQSNIARFNELVK